ncbi:MAG: NUDIX domain-containing protein [Clostridia bacterium]|nr:NUDIX domain-containing protein [Clostridia bacterium]
MRVSARAIIIENQKVLLMFRRKIDGDEVKEYYVVPGGGQDEGETLEQTVKRELNEELGVEIEIVNFVGEETFKQSNSHYFLCKITKGTPALGGEELDRMTQENFYQPQWVEIEKLDDLVVHGKEFVKKCCESAPLCE